MSYGEQTRNPHEHTEQDESEPLYCRGCGGYLCEYESQTPEQVQWWNGWPWCPEHAQEMREMAGPDQIDQVRR